MGLDMYLERAEKQMTDFIDYDIDELEETNPEVYKIIEPFVVECGTYIHWKSLLTDVGILEKSKPDS